MSMLNTGLSMFVGFMHKQQSYFHQTHVFVFHMLLVRYVKQECHFYRLRIVFKWLFTSVFSRQCKDTVFHDEGVVQFPIS